MQSVSQQQTKNTISFSKGSNNLTRSRCWKWNFHEYMNVLSLQIELYRVSHLKPFTKTDFFKHWAIYKNISPQSGYIRDLSNTVQTGQSNKKSLVTKKTHRHFKKYWLKKQKSKITLWIIEQCSDKCIK